MAKGDPPGWFEQLYREAEQGKCAIPRADRQPNPNLIEFWNHHPLATAGKTAAIVGCGLGDDAEQLAAWGFQTAAFDISESAIRACKRRFPGSHVHYTTADLLNPPEQWVENFDFVFESYTLQVLPANVRHRAIHHIVTLVRNGGLSTHYHQKP